MTIPLSILLYARGAGGVPSTSGRAENLRGWVDSYEDTIADRCGYESMRVSGQTTLAQARMWGRASNLMRYAEVYTPKGKKRWEGMLVEIEVSIGRVREVLSLKDMANSLTVRYSDASNGGCEASSSYTNAASIAAYGTKQRVVKLNGTSATGADNRAQTSLNQIAFPRSKEPSEAGTVSGGDISVTLTFAGRYFLLDWLRTSSTSTTVTATDQQLINLLTSYNSTNNFFSTDRANVVATGVSDVAWIDPDTTYRDKIESLFAQGDSAHERLYFGCFDDGAFTVKRWAGADPETITYYESSRTGEIRDARGNVVAPWDVRPDAMALVVDHFDADAGDDAIDTGMRKYVARVALSISSSGPRVRLEPDNVDSLESLLSSSAGGGPAALSDRGAAIQDRIQQAVRPQFPAGDVPTRFDSGVWQPGSGGTGMSNVGKVTVPSDGTIDLGGGSINTDGGTVTNTGGGNVDLGTGAGIGGSTSTGVSTTGGGGTTGRIPQWASASTLTDSTLVKSGAGVLTLSASGAFTLTVPATGTATLGTGTSGRVAEWSGTNSVQASTLVKSGAGVLTLSASSTATLTIDSSIRLDGTGASTDEVLAYNGTAFAPVSLASLGAVDGSGTASRVAQWNDTDTLEASTLVKSGAGVLTLSASGAFTLTVPATGTATLGTGTSGRVAEWSGTNSVQASTLVKSGAGVLTLSASGTATLTIDSSTRLDGAGASSGDVLTYNGTAYAPAAPATGVDGSGAANRVAYWSDADTITSDAGMTYNATTNSLTLTGDMEIGSNYTIGGDQAISKNGTTLEIGDTSTWADIAFYVDGVLSFNLDGDIVSSNGDILPGGGVTGSVNIGNASNYWNDVSYKTLTDRGCLPWYDDGVELQDGSIVSDVAALQAIQPHPYLTTPAGARRLDYSTLPKHVYKPAGLALETVYNRDGTVRYRAGDQAGEDGAETTALLGILIGAIKELAARLETLEGA